MAIPSICRALHLSCVSLKYKLEIFVDRGVQIGGPLYIGLAVSLISCIIYLFFSTILPSMYTLYSLQGFGHTILAVWLIFNIFFNYFYCIKTDPGSPLHNEDVGHVQINDSSHNASLLPRWCKRCQKPKPPLTHHCHVCRRCILKMDHHCPWMNNCIGFYNYRFFFVFLFYMWIGCGYTMYMASVPLRNNDAEEESTGALFTFIIALAVFFSLSGLFWFHVYLTLTAKTTIDFYAYRRLRREVRREARLKGEKPVYPPCVNEYDMGKLQNLHKLFDRGGSYWWLLMFLPNRLPPRGDGMQFICKSEGNIQKKPSHPSQYRSFLGEKLTRNLTDTSNTKISESDMVSNEWSDVEKGWPANSGS